MQGTYVTNAALANVYNKTTEILQTPSCLEVGPITSNAENRCAGTRMLCVPPTTHWSQAQVRNTPTIHPCSRHVHSSRLRTFPRSRQARFSSDLRRPAACRSQATLETKSRSLAEEFLHFPMCVQPSKLLWFSSRTFVSVSSGPKWTGWSCET